MGTHERKEAPAHHATPHVLSSIVLAAIVVGVVAGVMGLVSLVTHDDSAAGVSETAPPAYPMTFDTPTPTVTSYSVATVRPQSSTQTSTARSTVTARVTDVRVSAAPTVTVTNTPAPAPTVTKTECWDTSQAPAVQSDCAQISRGAQNDGETLAYPR